jgi:hypothetical protein
MVFFLGTDAKGSGDGKEDVSRDRVCVPARGLRALAAEFDNYHITHHGTAVVDQCYERSFGRCGVRDLLPASWQFCGH